MDLQSLVTGVEAYIQQRLSRYLEELRELCAIDSGSYNKAGLDEMAARLGARVRDLGMHVTIIEREGWRNDLYSVLRGNGGGTVLPVGPLDTLYPIRPAPPRPVRAQGATNFCPGLRGN